MASDYIKSRSTHITLVSCVIRDHHKLNDCITMELSLSRIYFLVCVFTVFLAVSRGDVLEIGNVEAPTEGDIIFRCPTDDTSILMYVVYQEGVLFAWSAHFLGTEPAYFQVWRPVDAYPNTYQLIADHKIYPSPVNGQWQIYLRDISKPCVSVKSGDWIALYNHGETLQPLGSVGAIFSSNFSRPAYTSYKISPYVGGSFTFSRRDFPCIYRIAAYIDTGDSDDICANSVIPENISEIKLSTISSVDTSSKPATDDGTNTTPPGIPAQQMAIYVSCAVLGGALLIVIPLIVFLVCRRCTRKKDTIERSVPLPARDSVQRDSGMYDVIQEDMLGYDVIPPQLPKRGPPGGAVIGTPARVTNQYIHPISNGNSGDRERQAQIGPDKYDHRSRSEHDNTNSMEGSHGYVDLIHDSSADSNRNTYLNPISS